MNIYQASRDFSLSLTKLRRMEKLGVLKLDKENSEVAKMRFGLSRRQPLTAAQLFILMDDPDSIYDLGVYETKAREQIAALGDVKAGAAPIAVYAYLSTSAAQRDEGVHVIAKWLREILPATPVGFHWVATRLVARIENRDARLMELAGVNLALTRVRRLPEMADYFRTIDGKVFYSQPNKYLDL